MTNSLRWAGAALLLVVTSLGGATAAAAQTRAQLIEEARAEFDQARGLTLLLEAVGSQAGPVDSLWTVATHEIAAAMLRGGDRELASGWLRLSARHGGAWPIDSDWFEPAVVALYEEGLQRVSDGTDPSTERATTAWAFPQQLDAAAPGDVVVTSAAGQVSLQVIVEGVGQMPETGRLQVPPGSYEIVATAPGYDSVRVSREVLPGVLTAVEVVLQPRLTADVQSRAIASLVRITTATSPGRCTTGFVADANGWVLTEYESVRGPGLVTVSGVGGAGTQYETEVSLFDEARNLAVLKLPLDGLSPLQADAAGVGDSPLWIPHFVNCEGAAAPLLPVTPASSTTGPLLLAEAVPRAALGAPIIDADGSLRGIVVDELAGLRSDQIGDLVERARQRLADEQVVVNSGGGGSWKWIVGGIAAAGGLVAALTVGGGDGGGDGPPGTITITVP